MIALDINDLPIRRGDHEMWAQGSWLLSPPAITQPVEDDWYSRDPSEGYSWAREVVLEGTDAGTRVERYTAKNGTVIKIDPLATDLADGSSLTEKLETIKSNLGIGMKHLAAALGVKRPTAYAWMKGTRAPQPKRWERIQCLLELSDHWRKLSRHPLSRRIFVPMESGQSVLDLLSAEALDATKIKEVLKILATDENDRSARLRDRAVAMRERMKEKGAKPLPDNVVDQSMRNISRW